MAGLPKLPRTQVMKPSIKLYCRVFVALVLTATSVCAQTPDQAKVVPVPDRDKVVAGAARAFEKVSKAVTMPAPGCAAAVSLNGETVFEKAFGLAEMEHTIPNTPQTIFESGSVAKQFTAAAMVL